MRNDKLNKCGRRARMLLICLMVESVMVADVAHSKSPGGTNCFKKIWPQCWPGLATKPHWTDSMPRKA